MTAEISGGDAAYLKDVVTRLDRIFAGQKPVARSGRRKRRLTTPRRLKAQVQGRTAAEFGVRQSRQTRSFPRILPA